MISSHRDLRRGRHLSRSLLLYSPCPRCTSSLCFLGAYKRLLKHSSRKGTCLCTNQRPCRLSGPCTPHSTCRNALWKASIFDPWSHQFYILGRLAHLLLRFDLDFRSTIRDSRCPLDSIHLPSIAPRLARCSSEFATNVMNSWNCLILQICYCADLCLVQWALQRRLLV